ncbi:MAG: DUF397 domain-containing protein, partial [Pseudomonas sp.]
MTTIPSFDNALWRKSSRSSASTDCVEVATTTRLIGIRDSNDPNEGLLALSSDQWKNFIREINMGSSICRSHAPWNGIQRSGVRRSLG